MVFLLCACVPLSLCACALIQNLNWILHLKASAFHPILQAEKKPKRRAVTRMVMKPLELESAPFAPDTLGPLPAFATLRRNKSLFYADSIQQRGVASAKFR